MDDSSVRVEISYEETCVLNESSSSVEGKDLQYLINVLKDTQQKTNECLTTLTKQTSEITSAELEKSDDATDDDDDEEDFGIDIPEQNQNDVSPKRAKIAN